MIQKFTHTQALALLGCMDDAHNAEVVLEFILDNTEDTDLAPCPFCGHLPLMNGASYVFCSNHTCTMRRKAVPHNTWQTRWSPNEE